MAKKKNIKKIQPKAKPKPKLNLARRTILGKEFIINLGDNGGDPNLAFYCAFLHFFKKDAYDFFKKGWGIEPGQNDLSEYLSEQFEGKREDEEEKNRKPDQTKTA